MKDEAARVKTYLESEGVEYEAIHHPPHYTAQQIAADTHTPGKEFAKTVFLKVDNKDAIAVLSAHHTVDCDVLRRELGAKEVRLDSEPEIHDVMDAHHIEGELGALPPFGQLFGLPVYTSRAMADDEHITFNAGTHEDVVRIRYADYVRLVHPQVMDFTKPVDAPQKRRDEE